jgi:hypothetical protein
MLSTRDSTGAAGVSERKLWLRRRAVQAAGVKLTPPKPEQGATDDISIEVAVLF